jgi:hypothetical protein
MEESKMDGYFRLCPVCRKTDGEQRKIRREAGLDDFEDISGHAFYPPLPDGVTVVGVSPYIPG